MINKKQLTISIKTAFEPRLSQKRTVQQNITPSAVKNRFLGSIIALSEVKTGHLSIPDTKSGIFTATLTNKYQHIIFAYPMISFYIGITDSGDISETNQWPNSTNNGSNLPIFFNQFDWGKTSVFGTDQVAVATAYNNTGSTQDVLWMVQWRVIEQPSVYGSNNS